MILGSNFTGQGATIFLMLGRTLSLNLKTLTFALVLVSVVAIAGAQRHHKDSAVQAEIRKHAVQAGFDGDEAVQANDLCDSAEKSHKLSKKELARARNFLKAKNPSVRLITIGTMKYSLPSPNAATAIKPLLDDPDLRVKGIAIITMFQVAPKEWPKTKAHVITDKRKGIQAIVARTDQQYQAFLADKHHH